MCLEKTQLSKASTHLALARIFKCLWQCWTLKTDIISALTTSSLVPCSWLSSVPWKPSHIPELAPNSLTKRCGFPHHSVIHTMDQPFHPPRKTSTSLSQLGTMAELPLWILNSCIIQWLHNYWEKIDGRRTPWIFHFPQENERTLQANFPLMF